MGERGSGKYQNLRSKWNFKREVSFYYFMQIIGAKKQQQQQKNHTWVCLVTFVQTGIHVCPYIHTTQE